MSLTEFETGLYHYLYDFFQDREFEMMAGMKQFRRMNALGFQNVLFSPTGYEQEIWLDVHIGLRYSPIEDIAQQFLDNHPDYRQESNTLIISVGKFHKNKYFRYKVENEEDLALCCDQIKEFLLYNGFAFLEKANSLSQLDKLLNMQPAKANPYLYNQVHRCFKGLIAAKLNNNPKYNDLHEAYQKYLELTSAKSQLQEGFQRMSQYLMHYSSN